MTKQETYWQETYWYTSVHKEGFITEGGGGVVHGRVLQYFRHLHPTIPKFAFAIVKRT